MIANTGSSSVTECVGLCVMRGVFFLAGLLATGSPRRDAKPVMRRWLKLGWGARACAYAWTGDAP